MRAMIVADFVTMRSMLAQMLAIMVVVGAVLSVATETLSTAVACAACTVPLLFLFSVAAYDEMGKWEAFRLGMPLSRAQVVRGRYASFAVVAVGAALFGLVIALGLAVLSGVLGGSLPIFEPLTLENNDFAMLACSAVMGLVVAIVMATLTLPFVARLGMTRSVRLVPLAVALVVAGTMMLFTEGGAASAAAPDLIAWLSAEGNLLVASLVALAVSVALYLVSLLASVRLYRSREF